MSQGPRGPANWAWARGGTHRWALHRWCEMQPSLCTWNIQILPAASLWSHSNRQGKSASVGGRKQQKQEEKQHTWERTDWHFLRENKQSQVSCVASLQLIVSGESGPSRWWWHLWSCPPHPPPNWLTWMGKLHRKPFPCLALLLSHLEKKSLLKSKTNLVHNLIFVPFWHSCCSFISCLFSATSVGEWDVKPSPVLIYIHNSTWVDRLAD